MRLKNLLIAVIFVSEFVYAGPFGLNKGDPLSSFQYYEKLNTQFFYTVLLPKKHPSFSDSGIAFITTDQGLCRFAAISDKSYATEAMTRSQFESITKDINSIYGPPFEYDFWWEKPSNDSFIESIKKQDYTLTNVWTKDSAALIFDTSAPYIEANINQIILKTEYAPNDELVFSLTFEFVNIDECNRAVQKYSAGFFK